MIIGFQAENLTVPNTDCVRMKLTVFTCTKEHSEPECMDLTQTRGNCGVRSRRPLVYHQVVLN